MELAEFVRLFPIRASNISWLFGAGTSVSAGLPSAYDLIWDFKRRIYCTEQGYQIHQFNNLSDSGLRNQIQNYFGSNSQYPPLDSPEEYSIYFQKAFSSPKDRAKYLEELLSGMQLSYGHKVLGMLMKYNFLNLIFTTNFDRAFENTAVQYFKNTDSWFKTDLDNAQNGLQLYQAQKTPLIVKLHGDYLSENLKNTSDELREQDKKLRHILTVSSYLNGLGVMGYSGRDNSVMDALFSALKQDNSFPNGIFWFLKSGSKPLNAVQDFIDEARSKSIEAHTVEIETFDTAWAEILKGFDKIPKEDLQQLNQNYFRRENKPLPRKGAKPPLIRLNAVKVNKFPSVARLYKCDAGNTKEIKQLIKEMNGDILVTRKRDGIVGFGRDEEFKRVFETYGDFDLDIFELSDKFLKYDDSSLKSLVTEALSKALTNGKPLKWIKRRDRNILIPEPKDWENPQFAKLKKELGNKVHGQIPNTKLTWAASLEISLQYKLGNAFLVASPSILATRSEEASEGRMISPFIKEFTARWYNDKYDRILSAWLEILFSNAAEIHVSTFDDIGKGVNASFKINPKTTHTKHI